MSTVQGGQGNIVTNGLVLNLDAANPRSYAPPFNGTTWQNIAPVSSSLTGSLVSGSFYTGSNEGSIVFDGVNDYVTTISTPSLLQGDPNLTVCAWMRRTANAGVNTGTWGIGGNVTNQGICSWWNNNSNQITIDTWGQATFTTGVTYPLNEWVFVAWQKIAGAMTRENCIIWRNLVSYTGNQLTILRPENVAPNINNNGITIAKIHPTYGTPVAIQTGKFWIYNRILSPTEITQNFNATRARFGI